MITNLKISSAIGRIISAGTQVSAPDINQSSFTFSPDIQNNTIRYGLSGITRIGNDLVKTIMAGRPYKSLDDFLNRIKITKPQMVNLIKSGAFDCFGNRVDVMRQYINMVSDTKKRITLQNMKMLIDFKLIPEEYDLECRVFNFNKYIKKQKNGAFYNIDENAYDFYCAHFDIDKLVPEGDIFKVPQTYWDAMYQKHMDIVRPYIQKYNQQLLSSVNERLTKDMWDKYCLGTISQWEMDSISCYIHEHELINVDNMRYGFADFNKLDESPVVERTVPIKGKLVPIFRLERIIGTVLDRDKAKKLVTLLTTSGVVTVKVYGVFQQYDRQISERGADGKKHVKEKSCFSRGNKIVITGIREGDSFIAKKYKSTPFHRIEIISKINNDGTIETRAREEE